MNYTTAPCSATVQSTRTLWQAVTENQEASAQFSILLRNKVSVLNILHLFRSRRVPWKSSLYIKRPFRDCRLQVFPFTCNWYCTFSSYRRLQSEVFDKARCYSILFSIPIDKNLINVKNWVESFAPETLFKIANLISTNS